MRNPSNLRKKDGNIPWKWIIVVVLIFSALYLLRSLDTGNDEDQGK
jgi:hypothetical protein